MASLAFGMIGQAVGGTLGGAIGGQIGWVLGSMLGASLFAEDIHNEGPRLSDLTVTSSTYGVSIPKVYGTSRIAGNIIWSSGINETSYTQESGGKGGSSQTSTTYTYDASFAIGLCKGSIVGIGKIWADGILIYNNTSSANIDEISISNALGVVVYTGSENQLPNSLIEADQGIGNTSANRGLAYIVFDQLQLADYGNRIPNLTFEVIETGSNTFSKIKDIGTYPDTTGWTVASLGYSETMFIEGYGDNIFAYGEQWYGTSLNKTRPIIISKQDIDGEITELYRFTLGASTDWYGAWLNIITSDSFCFGIHWAPGGFEDSLYEYKLWNREGTHIGTFEYPEEYVNANECCIYEDRVYILFYNGSAPGNEIIHSVNLNPTTKQTTAFLMNALYIHSICISRDGYLYALTYNSDGPGQVTGTHDIIKYSLTGTELDRWTFTPSVDLQMPANRSGTVVTIRCPGNDIIFMKQHTREFHIVNNGVYSFIGYGTYDDSSSYSAVAGWEVFGSYIYTGSHIQTPSPRLPFSRALYAYPINNNNIDIANIISDISIDSNLATSDIDVSTLTDTTKGYVRTVQMTGRNAITPLLQSYNIKVVESDYKLVFSKKDGSIDETILEDQLSASVDTEENSDKIITRRIQETDLPRRVLVSYSEPTRDYAQATQKAQRIID